MSQGDIMRIYNVKRNEMPSASTSRSIQARRDGQSEALFGSALRISMRSSRRLRTMSQSLDIEERLQVKEDHTRSSVRVAALTVLCLERRARISAPMTRISNRSQRPDQDGNLDVLGQLQTCLASTSSPRDTRRFWVITRRGYGLALWPARTREWESYNHFGFRSPASLARGLFALLILRLC